MWKNASVLLFLQVDWRLNFGGHAVQMAFPVSLSIFEHHFCFCSEHHRKRCPIALPHAQVIKVEKQDNSGTTRICDSRVVGSSDC